MLMDKNRVKILLFLLGMTAIALSIFLSVTIYSYYQISDRIASKMVYLKGNLSHINSDDDSLFYRDFMAFSDTKPVLNRLKNLRYQLEGNFAAKTFYRSESQRSLNQIQQIHQRYERKMDIVDEILEIFKEDIAFVEQQSSTTRSLVHKVANGTNQNSDLADYRRFLNEINQLEKRLDDAEKKLNAKRANNGDDKKIQFSNRFIHLLEKALRGDSERLSVLKANIESVKQTLQTVRSNHAVIIRGFHSRTGLVNIVVDNLQPVTNNLSNWIQPVQNNIRTLEQNIMPGVTGLSMIRSIDPVSYQAIILIRDTNNAILRLDNEMNELIRNVVRMQNVSGTYLRQQNRSNHGDFVRQAAQTRNYLNGKITLFDPTIDNLNRALDQIANYQRAVSRIRNRTVSNILHSIGSQSSTTMINIMAPMRAYRDNVNQMISDLDRVAEIERTYETLLSKVTSFQYVNRAATDAALSTTLRIHTSKDFLTPLILINTIGLFFVGILVFIFIRQRDNGVGNKELKNRTKEKELSREKEQSTDKPVQKVNTQESQEKKQVTDVAKEQVSDKTEISESAVGEETTAKDEGDGSEKDDEPGETSVKKEGEDNEKSKIQSQNKEFDEFLESAGDKTLVVTSAYGYNEVIPGHLLILNGIQKGKRLTLHGISAGAGLALTIGRDSPDWRQHVDQSKHDVHVRVTDESQSLSRLQAEIIYAGGKCYIRNLSNSNPTLVNGKELFGSQSVILEHGTIIKAGYIQLQYHL